MKLCKDCMHADVPVAAFGIPRCDHPRAEHDEVYGRAVSACLVERSKLGACGPSAIRFEPRSKPAPAPDAGSIVYVEAPELRRSWIQRILGR